ncbi:IcmT/TraK family protein [Ramlibacter sp. AN1133]|uniref:IcmT/TraK family protein n=1 Tax=Ramlibacter sp. AN1133 TaxID=3133429 RepID=UPI0030C5A989
MAADWPNAVRGTQLLWLPIPAYSALPILLWVMHARTWTFVLALAVCAALGTLKAKGREVLWVVRRLHSKLRGGVVYARPVWYRRRMQHLDSFDLVELRDPF